MTDPRPRIPAGASVAVPSESSPSVELPPAALQPSAELKQRVLAAIAEQPAPTRAVNRRRMWVWTLGSSAAALLVFFLAGGPRVTGRPIALLVGTALGTCVVAAVVVWAALLRGKSSMGRARQLVLPIVLCAVPSILMWKVLWSGQFDGALVDWPTRPGFRCLGLSLSMALFPLLAFLLAQRGSDARRPALTGLAGAIAIGTATTLLTDLWCPVAYVPHLMLGHALPIAILGAAGAWLGHQLLGLKRK
jgi:hypothetical protein